MEAFMLALNQTGAILKIPGLDQLSGTNDLNKTPKSLALLLSSNPDTAFHRV